MNQSETKKNNSSRYRLICIIGIIALSFGVRAGTAHFLETHLNDPAWFQYGSYKIFDQRAQNIIDGVEPVFFFGDATRTDLIQYPPAFPLLVGLIYTVTGDRTAHAVQQVQWPLDALITPLLMIGIASTVFGWRAAYFAGVMAAISPLLAFYGATPTADAITAWVVLGAVWLLLISCKRRSWRLAFLAGILLGSACWIRVNPLFMFVPLVLAVIFFTSSSMKQRVRLCGALVVGTLLIVAPIVVRNVLVYRQFVLTGLSVGVNLWEGLGETELGRENGFLYGDDLMIQHERRELGRPDDTSIEPFWPDGINRDRERAKESIAFILQHPIWYAGVIMERMYWMLKIAGEPGPYYGTAGINCTSDKCLSEEMRSTVAAVGVKLLGMVQSVYRFLTIPLAVLGILFGWRRDRELTCVLLATVLYYLVTSSIGHTELRYVLPMHAVLSVFAALGLVRSAEWLKDRVSQTLVHREV